MSDPKIIDAIGTGPSDFVPTRPNFIPHPVAVESLIAEIMARPEPAWTDAIRAVLEAHAGKLITKG